MKKFIFTSLALTLLFPSPILATSDEQNSSFAEMEEVDVISEVILEASLNSVVLQTEDGSFKKSVEFPANVTTAADKLYSVYEALPEGYCFTKALSADSLTSPINIEKLDPLPAELNSMKSKAQIYARCKINSNDFFYIDIKNWDTYANGDSIPAKSLNKVIAEKQSSLYTTSYGLSLSNLKPVLVKDDNGSVKVSACVLYNPITLSTETKDNLANKEVVFQFENNKFKLRAGNFNIQSNGNITINQSNLKRALEELTKTDGKVTGNAAFIVDNFNPITINIFTQKNNPITIAKDCVKVGYTSNTPIKLVLQSGGTTFETSTTYGNIFDNLGNPTEAKVQSYLRNNWNRLSFETLGSKSIVQSIQENKFNNIDFRDQLKVDGKLEVLVRPTADAGAFFDKSYSITFKDSTTDSVIKRDNRLWKEYFKINAIPETLTPEVAVRDLIPSGYKIAVKQEPKSTSDKKNPAGSGDYSLSIYQTNAVIYLTSTSAGNTTTEEPKPSTPAVSSQGSAVMHRLFNPVTNEHLYTKDASEKDNLLNSGEWNDEGHGWTAPAVSAYPVYRVYNPNSGEHHYTKDKNEYDTLVSYGWVGEEKAFFSADDLDSKVTLYRLYNPNAPKAAQHHYTVYESERDDLLKDGWVDEGTAWYGLPMD